MSASVAPNSSEPRTAQDVVVLESLTVQPDRVEARVRIDDPRYQFTTPELIADVVNEFSTLPHHTCRNSKGPTFGAVMDHTSLAHLVEHLVIDLQTHEYAAKHSEDPSTDQVVFTGTTQQSAEDPHVSIVRVSFRDDLIALAAFKKALHFINRALAQPSASEA